MVTNRFASTLILVSASLFLLLVALPLSSQSENTEEYYVTVSRSKSSCNSYPCDYYCYWGWWWCRRCYYRSNCQYCSTTYYTEQVKRTKCKATWAGPNCDIPVCSPACTNGKTCRPGGRCECVTPGGTQCKSESCPAKSCYPGTCTSTSLNTCQCPSEFSGDNCEILKQTPKVSDCSVKLFTGPPDVEVARADCDLEGISPKVTWVNRKSFSKIEASWEATHKNPYEAVLPTDNPRISDARFGVTRSKATAVVRTPNTTPQNYVGCTDLQNEELPPQANVKCNTRSIPWSELGGGELAESDTIEVSVSARLGGFKKLISNAQESFTGINETVRQVLFKVDAQSPSHCRRVNMTCQDPAIYLDQDAVQKAVIQVTCSNWFDHGSGIEKYYVEIYELAKQSDNLVTPQTPEKKIDVPEGKNFFQYTFPKPGVYSIEVTVSDFAKNSYKARKIVLFDSENSLKTSEKPVKVLEASADSGYRWITDPPRVDMDGQSRLTLNWNGRYFNKRHLDKGWLNRVLPLEGAGIDDNLLASDGTATGNRTIHEITHINGTVGVRLAFKVDQQGGKNLENNDIPEGNLTSSGELPQNAWFTFRADRKNVEQRLVMPRLNSNDTIVIWIVVYDIVSHFLQEKIEINFDTTPPYFDSSEPVKFNENVPDQYRTSIDIRATDMESGIREVRYFIRDSNRNNITSDRVESTRMTPDGTRKKRALAVCKTSSTTCYCTTRGECFDKSIRIVIDHCLIDRYYTEDRAMELRYTVVNNAGREAGAQEAYLIKFQNGPPKCRPVTLFTTGTILAIAIGILVLIVLLILVLLMVLRWKQNKHPIPDRVRTLASSMRQRVTNTEKVHSADGRVIYRTKTKRGNYAEEDEDIYVDGSDPGGWRVNRDQLELGETLAEGRFAIVKKGLLRKGGETKPVAAKYLRAGSSDSDKTLLKAKIAFHGNRVPPHENIVRLIGVVDEGPIMLLELCDMTLKAWLSNVTKVTEDTLEHMLNFIMHIASGMEFLHSKSIIHRRLAVRNVLLKSDGVNGLVAKLIGFGTFTDPAAEGDNASEDLVVPLKWLAPETLESVGKGKAVYTQKSDVWAFGVTVWEIYSLGAAPYPGKKSSEVEALLKTGHRMPRPEECPPELFDEAVKPCWNVNAKKRPDFKILLKVIKNFRSGGETQEGYYAPGVRAQTYADPKERTSEYTTRAKGNVYSGDQLYDDARN